MNPAKPFRGFSLHYIDTQEYKIGKHLSRSLENGEYAVFGFVLKGSAKITLTKGQQQRTAKVMYGEIFLIPTDCHCTIHNDERQPTHVILIRLLCDKRPDFAGGHPFSMPFIGQDDLKLHRIRMPQVYNWVQDLLNEGSQAQPEPFLYFQVQSYLYAIAAEFMAVLEKPKGTDDLMDYVLQIKQNILDHCGAPMDVEEVARLSGSSYTRFYQAFKKLTGLSPLKFMTIARMNESLRLLANHPSSIMEVAHSVGYTDELYFSRLFKKQMGLSPTEYASCAKKRVANLCPVFSGDLTVLGITPVLELPREWYADPNKNKYYKQVEQCRPELILTAPVPDGVYRTLSQIAPVIMIQWKGYSWRDRLLQISRILGIPTVAERWLSYFRTKVEHARSHLREHLGEEPFLVVSALEPFYRVYGMQRMKMKDLFYDELQVKPPASAHRITFLDVTTLTEVASLDCNNILILAPASFSDESCIRLEEEWMQLHRSRPSQRCICIRHEEPLLYNASFYDRLIDQFVDHLIS